jgi:hypothetical protein
VKNHVTPLQHGLIALDKLWAAGDLTDAEYLAAVEPLKVAIQRALLVDHLDWLVREHNDPAVRGVHAPIACRDELLDNVDRHETYAPVSIARLRLVTRRLEQLNDNTAEVLPQ